MTSRVGVVSKSYCSWTYDHNLNEKSTPERKWKDVTNNIAIPMLLSTVISCSVSSDRSTLCLYTRTARPVLLLCCVVKRTQYWLCCMSSDHFHARLDSPSSSQANAISSPSPRRRRQNRRLRRRSSRQKAIAHPVGVSDMISDDHDGRLHSQVVQCRTNATS